MKDFEDTTVMVLHPDPTSEAVVILATIKNNKSSAIDFEGDKQYFLKVTGSSEVEVPYRIRHQTPVIEPGEIGIILFDVMKKNFLGRFFKKPIEPNVSKRAVPELPGNMSAHQAWAVVVPLVRAMDKRATLTLITSGLDIDSKGCSHTWEFIFFLPGRNRRTMFSLEPDPQASDIDQSPPVLTQRIDQASPLDVKRPSFPEQFRDSPEVVAEFSAKGVDYVAGPSDMKLEGRVLPSGQAVWVTCYWDQEYTTSFDEMCG